MSVVAQDVRDVVEHAVGGDNVGVFGDRRFARTGALQRLIGLLANNHEVLLHSVSDWQESRKVLRIATLLSLEENKGAFGSYAEVSRGDAGGHRFDLVSKHLKQPQFAPEHQLLGPGDVMLRELHGGRFGRFPERLKSVLDQREIRFVARLRSLSMP